MVTMMTDVFEFPNVDDLAVVYPAGTIVKGMSNGQRLSGVVAQTFPGPYPYLVTAMHDGKDYRLAKTEVHAVMYPVSTPEAAERFLAS